MKGPFAGTMRGLFVDRRSPLPPELERFREEAKRPGEAYDWSEHFKTHGADGQLVRHAQLMSDELADELAKMSGLVGTPQQVLPKFKALWQAASTIPNVGFFFVAHGTKGGRKRSFELFVREILPKLRGA